MVKRKAATPRQVPASFENEEPDFPRGGGAVLTPSEVREAEEQAETEFANEGKGSRKKQKKVGSLDELDREKVPKSVELLRYKSLSVGMKLWGIVLEVGRRDLVVSLPGGLRGFVKAVDALDFFSQDKDVGSFSSDVEDLQDIYLKENFSEGQLVSCVVIQLDTVNLKESKKRSKRIGLSLRLSHLHNGLTIDAMHEGLVLSAFVTSIEDHGYLVSFGVPGITGFLRRLCGEAGAVPMLKKGQLVQSVIHSVDRKRCMVMLLTDPDSVASAVAKEMEGLSMELLLPGTLVNARVGAVLKNGLLLSFLTYFTGMVNIFHLEDPLPPSDWRDTYSKNQRLKARILYVDNTNKSIGLSLNSQLVQNRPPTIGVNIGDVYERAIVRRVDITIGLLLELPFRDATFASYAHISDVSDEHVEKLQETFKEGQKLKARVIGKRLMDGLAVVTLKDSKVNQRVLSCADVHPGMTVLGEITSIEVFGAFVKLADGVKALCPLQQMSEFQRSKPSAKFKVGAILKFKVLTCASDTKKITLTHKKTMVSSKLTPLITYEEAVEGLVTHGWISGVEDYGCFVCFYNSVKGLVHRTELGLDPGVEPKSVFQTGQVVRCRVLRADPSAQRLSLSFNLSPSRVLGLHKPHVDGEKVVSVGDEVCGLVTHVSDSLITLDVPLSNNVGRAFMKVELLSDFSGHAEQLRSLLYPGYKFEHLRVLERDDQKLVVTSKFSLVSAKYIPHDVSQLNSQEVIPGYIASITDRGCFVRFLGGLTGLASLPQLLDGFVHDPFKHFAVGQSVRAKVLEVNLMSGRFNLSLKQSHCYSTDTTFLKGYFVEEEKIAELQASKSDGADLDWGKAVGVGKVIEGDIQDIKEYGVIVNVQNLKDVVGFVTHHQLDSAVKVGDHVTARILDVVKSDGILDLTLRSDLVKSGSVSTSQTKKIGRKRANAIMEIGQKAWAIIELIKDEYLVCSLPDFDNAIAFASAHDYNLRVDPHEKYTLGQRVEVSVGSLAEGSEVGRLLLLLTSFSDLTRTHFSKRVKGLSKLESQTLIHGEVLFVGPLEMKIKLGKNSVGKVHVTHVTDDLEEENPLSRYTVGQSVTAKILRRSKQIDDGSLIKCYDLTIKPSELGGEGLGLSSSNTLSLSSLQVGQVVTAYVREVQDDWAWLLISPSIMGRLFVLDSSTDPIQLGRFKARYKTGQAVRCRIEKIDPDSGKLDFSLRDLDPASEYQEVCEVKINDVLGGRVSKILPGVGGLGVQIGSHIFGRVHITQLHDIWKDNPALDFKVGQFVKCIVLDVSKSEDGGTNQVDLSLRQSLINAVEDRGVAAVMNTRLPNPTVEKMEDLSVGMEVQGFVKSIINKGCFVTLSRHLDARIKLSNLAETFINDPGSLFPVGKLVKGRVISLEPLSGFVEMSLRSSFLNDESNNSKMLALKEIHVGDMVTGVVARIESYGIFISICNSKIVGLCHISQVSDSRISNLEALFKPGDRVQAKVLKVNEDKKQISLGMKDTCIKEMHAKEELTKGKIENSQHEESLFEQVLDTDVPLEKDEGENKDDDSLTDGLCVSPLSLPDMTVFDSHVEPLDVILDTDENTTSEDVVTKEMDSPMRTETKEKSTKRLKRRIKNLREAAIQEAEQKRLNGDEAPESSEDFEKLVHGSPNSSFIWIKYMAFLLSLGDIEKARAVADRALQIINFREEGEKLNVWVALLNLENAYGNPAKEATLGVFNRALQYCDPKKLYLALLGIYERSGQHDMVDELLKTMLQKFKMSCKVWLKRIHNFLRQSMPEAAHKTLDRALLSLPQRKHIKAISQAAIAEFKIGSAERARNLFESILRNYPKRVDLWNVYLDQETVLGDSSVIRALFERVTSLELPPKKMKSLFKKYLEYEKMHGNEERVEYVKAKAMQYVETRIGLAVSDVCEI